MKAILYDKFLGRNDTALTSSLSDSDLRIIENMDYVGGGVTTRPGTIPYKNMPSVSDFIRQVIEYLPGGISTPLAVYGNKLYRLKPSMIEGPPSMVLVQNLASREGDSFQIKDALYFGDGTELYEYGKLDYTTAAGTVNIVINDTVKNTPPSSGGGASGEKYRAKVAQTAVNLATANFADTAKWEWVDSLAPDVPDFIRAVRAFDASKKEKVKLVIGYNSSAAANVTITLNGVSKTVALASGDTATAAAGKIRAATFTGWTTSGSGGTVYFESNTAGPMDDTGHEYDAGTTQAYGTMSVTVQGKTDDNNIAAVRKCRIFLQHPLSRKIFAIGNPSDPRAVYYSGIPTFPDDPTYWPKANVLYPTTPEAAAIGMVLLSDSLLVGFTGNWYAWSGIDTSSDATWKLLNLPIGPVSPRCIAPTPNGFTFLASSELYEVSSNILTSEVLLLQNQETIRNLTKQKADEFMGSVDRYGGYTDLLWNPHRMVFFEERVYLATNAGVLIYDRRVQDFTVYKGWNVGGWCPVITGDLLFSGTNYLFQTGVGTTDNGIAIQSKVRTKDFDLGNGVSQKVLMDLYLHMKQYDGVAENTANVTLLGDYAKDEIDGLSLTYDQVYLDESLVWGRSWGRIWGYSEIMELIAHPNVKSRTFGVQIESDDPIGLLGIGFGFVELRPAGREIESGRELVE